MAQQPVHSLTLRTPLLIILNPSHQQASKQTPRRGVQQFMGQQSGIFQTLNFWTNFWRTSKSEVAKGISHQVLLLMDWGRDFSGQGHSHRSTNLLKPALMGPKLKNLHWICE